MKFHKQVLEIDNNALYKILITSGNKKEIKEILK